MSPEQHPRDDPGWTQHGNPGERSERPALTLEDFNVLLPWQKEGLGECRSCHQPIAWARYSSSGKLAPFDPDGTSHFATCPDAGRWRKR